MAQFNPQTQQGGGRGGGGRGYQGRGGPQQQGRSMGAWQPSAPTSSLQQAAYGRQPQQGGFHPQQHHINHHHQQHHHPQGAPPQHGGPPHGGPPYHAVNAPHHYNPYAQQPPYRGGQAGPGGWQPTGYHPQGGVYYPPANAGMAGAPVGATPVVQPPKPREKKPLVITDKNGNVLDFRSEAAQKKSSLAAAVAASDPKPATTEDKGSNSKDPGSKLREAALARLKEEEKAKDQKPKEDAAKAEKAETSAPAVADKTTPAPAPVPEPAKAEPTKAAKAEPTKAAKVEPTKAEPAPAKEEKKEEPKKEPAKTLAAVAAAPPPAPAPVKPSEPDSKSGSSLAAAAKKPSLAAIAAAPAPVPPKSSAGGLRPGGKTRASPAPNKGRLVYDKAALMKLKMTESCMKRPESLPDMTIVKGPAKQQGGGGGGGRNRGGGGGNWDRGQNQGRRGSQHGNNNNNDSWGRGQQLPKGKGRNNNRRNSNHNNNQPPLSDGPVAPLKRTKNGWKPTKNTSPYVVAEKQVKGILNKMTKEKFDRLSAQMCDIQILSYDMLTMMIHNVYEKAIDEPAFGDMYADLCVKLSKGAAQANNDFVKIIESDEEPPIEGEDGDGAPSSQQSSSSSHVVYRWSNDVSTTDDEVVGPLPDEETCIQAALDDSEDPQPRGDMTLELVKLRIKNGIFIKILKKKDATPSDGDIFYCVYFKVEEAEECGQQLSEIFLSEVECISSAKKKNSFKRSLLNKCEDEFKKQDIYVDWKKEKKEYEETKGKLKPAEQAEKEEELDFRRIKIKKQMLGNIKFIGQLYKKGLLKEKIMRFCIGSLLKLEELPDVKAKNPEYKDSGDMDMDEEDHEAICSMFTTIGSTIDKPPAADFMNVCFTKIQKLSQDKKNLPARSRFMYKDLLELRDNKWVPRRDEGKAKTLEEIRKDVEREEKIQQQQSAQSYRSDGRGGGGRGGYDNRRGSSNFGGRGSSGGGNRGRPSTKTQQETDDDGFTVIARGAKGHFQGGGGGGGSGGGSQRNIQSKPMSKSGSKTSFAALEEKKSAPENSNAPAPLSPEKLERRIKSMRVEFMQDPNNLKELLISADELSGTKDAGFKLVERNLDAILDCKEAERKAINEIIRILYEKEKLSQSDIRNALADFIEFIDSMTVDCPKVFEYVGELLSELFKVGAVDVKWFCEAVEKTKMDPNAQAPEKLTRATITSIRSRDGVDAAKKSFGSNESALNSLLGADKWSSISKDLLG